MAAVDPHEIDLDNQHSLTTTTQPHNDSYDDGYDDGLMPLPQACDEKSYLYQYATLKVTPCWSSSLSGAGTFGLDVMVVDGLDEVQIYPM